MSDKRDESPKYEKSDVSVRSFFTVVAGAAIFAVLLGSTFQLGLFAMRRIFRTEIHPPPPFRPPPPRLQVDESQDLEIYRRQQNHLLQSSGSTAQGRHIPIDRAMEILSHE